MRFGRKPRVPEGYELGFKQANAIFHHARIYDASARKLSFLKPLSTSFVNEFNGDLDFLGPDLPPSRAFAIAQGRLDPISMCAFDEFENKEPALTQQVFGEAQSARRNSREHPPSLKGDVWLGTDEDLLPFLAAREPEHSQSPSHISAYSLPIHERPADNGFVAHLASISRRKLLVQSSVEEQQPPATSSSIVTLSPGKKRVLASPPNNNLFKRRKKLDEAFKKSCKAQFLFSTKLDGELSCRGNQCSEDAVLVPVHSSQDAGQSSDARGEDGLMTVGKTAGGESWINNFQALACAELATISPTAMFMEHVESQRGIDNRSNGVHVVSTAQEAGVIDVAVQPEVKLSTSFCTELVRPQHISNMEDVVHQEPPLMASMHQDGVEQQFSSQGCANSLSLKRLRTSVSLPMHHAGTDDPKTPTFTNKLHREAKAQKQFRSFAKQSRRVVMAASMPNLLKFFQKAPTHCGHSSCF